MIKLACYQTINWLLFQVKGLLFPGSPPPADGVSWLKLTQISAKPKNLIPTEHFWTQSGMLQRTQSDIFQNQFQNWEEYTEPIRLNFLECPSWGVYLPIVLKTLQTPNSKSFKKSVIAEKMLTYRQIFVSASNYWSASVACNLLQLLVINYFLQDRWSIAKGCSYDHHHHIVTTVIIVSSNIKYDNGLVKAYRKYLTTSKSLRCPGGWRLV